MMEKHNLKSPLKTKMIKFGKLCKVQGGFAFKSTWYKGDGIPLVRISSLVNSTVQFDEKTVFLDPSRLKEYSDFTLKKGDTLIAMSGATTGKMAVYSDNQEALLNQRVGRFKLLSELPVDPKYISYLVIQLRDRVLKDAYGAAQPNISPKQIEDIEVPYFPLNEQRLIVAEIEKQFSRLDEAVASLKRIQANLKRYKAAVLKAAVEGKLTEQWRKDHPDVEPADQLLKRILAERRDKWETEELAKMKAKGIKPKDDSWKKKYKEPAWPDTANLPELPEGWVWAKLEAIAALKGGITVDKKRKDPTARLVPYLRVANVQRGYLNLTEMKEIEASQSVIEELSLIPGDILFNEGGDRDKLGRGWIWEGQLPECIHQNHVFRARLCASGVSAKLISWWGNTFGKDYFLRAGKQTTNLASINITKLSEFPIPLMPEAEQHQIVEEIERRLSVTEELEATIETNLKRAERLRQTILQQAFSGGLV
ncbi:MAG: restriction endonuclease subunit S [Desulfuromonadales bacterium]|nr:restriction endonuclease subunit S [Desulfuromonadales bacterium]